MAHQHFIKIRIEDNDGLNNIIELPYGDIKIGRDKNNQVVLPERNISRKHARLLCQGNVVLAEDLESSGGVWRNDERLHGLVPLKEGDILTIGDYKITLLKNSQEQMRSQQKTETGIYSISPSNEGQFIDLEAEPNDPRCVGYPRLIGISSAVKGKVYLLKEPTTLIGRTRECHIRFKDYSISRIHAHIFQDAHAIKVVDLGSSNGVGLNEKKTTEANLKHGDLLSFGQIWLRFAQKDDPYYFFKEDELLLNKLAWQRFRSYSLGLSVPLLILIILFSVRYFKAVETIKFYTLHLNPRDLDSWNIKNNVDALQNWLKGQVSEKNQMTAIQENIQQKNWQSAYEKIIVLEKSAANTPEIKDLKKKLKNTQIAEKSLEQIQILIKANRWQDAWNHLQSVDKSTFLEDDIQKDKSLIREHLWSSGLEDARQELIKRHFAAAEAELNEIESLANSEEEKAQWTALYNKIKEDQQKYVEQSQTHKKDQSEHPAPASKKTKDSKMPQNAGQFYEEALKSFNKNEMPLSLEYSKACLAADNNYALCYRLLGIIYSRLGQAEKSVAAYRNYVEKAPNSDEAAEVRKLIRRYDEIKKNNETR